MLLLPKVFDIGSWKRLGSPKELEEYIDKAPYISYTQLTSFLYRRSDWITTYLMDKRVSNIWMEFGSEVGKYIELQGNVNFKDFKYLTKDSVEHIPLYDSTFEFEKPIYIVIEIEGEKVILLGYIDVFKAGDKLIDIKTGNIKNMLKQYSDPSYMQTRLYLYAMDLAGEYNEEYCGVQCLSRKGRGTKGSPLVIEKDRIEIPTKYVSTDVEEYIEEVVKPAILSMSEYTEVYKKIKDG